MCVDTPQPVEDRVGLVLAHEPTPTGLSNPALDFPFTLVTSPLAWNVDPMAELHPRHAAADVILFSGCEDDECSADASCRYGLPAGA